MSDNLIDTLAPLEGFTVSLYADEDASYLNPRDNDNLGRMVCFHKRYTIGDKHTYREDDYTSWTEVLEAIEAEEGLLAIACAIYMIDHSGTALRVGNDFSDCDPGDWDSGQVGWVFVTRAAMDKEYGATWDTEQLAQARKCIDSEVNEYGRWANGEVYGYVVRDADGEDVDSCWGYIGYEWAEQAAEEALRGAVWEAFKRDHEMDELLARHYAV